MKYWFGVLIAVAVVVVRLLIPHAAGLSFDSYAHVMQAEHIASTGVPLLSYELSGTSTRALFSPVYDYGLAFTGIFFGMETGARIIAAVLAGLLVLGVFVFVVVGTKNGVAATLAALAAAVVPEFWADVASASSINLGVVLGLWWLICFLQLEKKVWRVAFLVLLVLGALTSAMMLVFVVALLAYLALAEMARVQRPRGEHEFVFFALLFVSWLFIVALKDVFVVHGFGAIWQNTPALLQNAYFVDVRVLDAVVAVGVLPFLGGMYVLYRHLFAEHERAVYLLMGLVVTTGVLSWTKLVTPEIGLRVLSVGLVALFGFAVRDVIRFVSTTRFAWVKQSTPWLIAAVLLVGGIAAADEVKDANAQAVSSAERAAAEWLRAATPDDSVVAGAWSDGFLISALAGRTPVANGQFLLQPESAERVGDLQTLFTAPFTSEAVTVLGKYDADFVLWSRAGRRQVGRAYPAFDIDTACFPRLFEQSGVIVYGVACGVESGS